MGKSTKSTIASGTGISVEAGALSQALGRVLPVCHRKTTIPVLSTVRIAANRQSAELACMDLDIEIRTHLAAAGKLEPVCVDPRVLRDIVRGLPAKERVTLQATKTHELVVLVGDEEWRLPTWDANDFPPVNQPGDAPLHGSFQLDAGYIGDVLARVAPFISANECRYELTGALLEPEGDRLFAVTTDGSRLGRIERTISGVAAEMEAAGFVAGERRCIISRNFLRAVLGLVRGPAKLTLSASPPLCRLDADGVTITGKLIDCTFPDYHRALVDPIDAGYEVDRLALLSALSRLKAIEERSSSRIIALCWRKGALYLERRDADRGRASIPVPAATFGQWPATPVSFDRSYIAAIAQQVRGSALRMHWTGSETGSQVRITDASDPAATFILMPMRGETALDHEPPTPPAEPELRAAE